MMKRTLNAAQLRQQEAQGKPYEWDEHDDLSAELAARGYPADLTLTPAEALVAQVRALAADHAQERQLSAEIDRLRSQEAELPKLRELADLGRRYRSETLADAMTAGRAAMGAGFDEAAYRTLLADAPLEAIRRMRDDWQRSTRIGTQTAHAAVRRPVVH